jgi:hypothetical protein
MTTPAVTIKGLSLFQLSTHIRREGCQSADPTHAPHGCLNLAYAWSVDPIPVYVIACDLHVPLIWLAAMEVRAQTIPTL